MTAIAFHDRVFERIERRSAWVLPTAARFVFAAVLLVYYWNSALTKLGDGAAGLLRPSTGAYAQIFPRAIEAVGYDPQALSLLHSVVVLGATWAEFLLPLLLVAGLMTRLAALGMIGFVVVQSVVDVTGHGADASTIGAWFDGNPASPILDQRSLWILLLAVPVLHGGGPLSVDRWLGRRGSPPTRRSASG